MTDPKIVFNKTAAEFGILTADLSVAQRKAETWRDIAWSIANELAVLRTGRPIDKQEWAKYYKLPWEITSALDIQE